MEHKICSKCRRVKPLDEFFKDKNHRDGLRSDCKACTSAQTGLYAKVSRAGKKRKHDLYWKKNPQINKECRICHTVKSFTEFNKHADNTDGLRGECKECQQKWSHNYYKTIAVEERKKRKIHRTENPDQYRNSYFKRTFGITLDDYNQMFENQKGKCMICGTEKGYPNTGRRLAVDHDHKTGKVRALLCGACNTGISHFKHDPDIMRKAINYLLTF